MAHKVKQYQVEKNIPVPKSKSLTVNVQFLVPRDWSKLFKEHCREEELTSSVMLRILYFQELKKAGKIK